ncbi:MAG: helix-turn-helix transcriptional regulator [Clostridiales bacterium]|nr:helix-turn-helix transcriptional regulator [Clostridiales bacterium]
MEDNSILVMCDYGKIKIHLKELMDERGLTRYKLSRQINSRFEVIDKWYHGEVEKLDLDVLARICYVLKCGISDILEYCE